MKEKNVKEPFKAPDKEDARKAIVEDFRRRKRRLVEEDVGLEELTQLTETLKKQSKKKR